MATRYVVRGGWTPATPTRGPGRPGTPGNPSRGQCGTAALVLQDLLGGELLLPDVTEDGADPSFHCWNRLPDGCEVDLTRQQFRPGERVGPRRIVHRPPGPPRRGAQDYALLRARVLAALDGPSAGRLAADH